jgi:hypothetical protein
MKFKSISLYLALALAITPVMAAENKTIQTSQNETPAQSIKENDSKKDQNNRRAAGIVAATAFAAGVYLLLSEIVSQSKKFNELQELSRRVCAGEIIANSNEAFPAEVVDSLTAADQLPGLTQQEYLALAKLLTTGSQK